MNGMDLFAGSGIGSLALKNIIPDYKTVCYVEWEAYCQAILIARIKDGLLDDAPIWDDVRTFDGKQWRGKVDIVYGGFPCQPFSVAGKRQGETDEKNMWPDTVRIIGEVRPRFALLENVPGLFVFEYIRQIFGSLAEIGYDCEWLPLSASEVGAPHRRERAWILAYPNGGQNYSRIESESIQEKQLQSRTDSRTEGKVADPKQQGLQRSIQRSKPKTKTQELTTGRSKKIPNSNSTRCLREGLQRTTSNGNQWDIEPNVGRVAHGVAFRVDRLKMLGNGWVPQVVKRILEVRNHNDTA